MSYDSSGDESAGNDSVKKRRRGRVRFTDRQVELLEARFVQDQYLPAMERTHLATVVGLNESQVKTWFQNRRAKSKRAAKRKARAAALASQPHGVMSLSTSSSSACAALRQCSDSASSGVAAQSAQSPYAGYATNAYGTPGGQVYANGAGQAVGSSYTGSAPSMSPQQQYAMLGGLPANGPYSAHAPYAGSVNSAYHAQSPAAAAQAAYGAAAAATMGYESPSGLTSPNAYSMYADQGLDYSYARFMNASAPALLT